VEEALCLVTPDNANYQPRANRGCYNLLSCALRSFYGALILSARSAANAPGDSAEHELARIRGLVGGVLWSQGENDSIDVPQAQRGVLRHIGNCAATTYEHRQEAFMHDLRWCLEGVVLIVHQNLSAARTLPPPPPSPALSSALLPAEEGGGGASGGSCWPPIVLVASTATRPWMVHLRDVRHAQLSAPARVHRLLVVDALGSFLKDDCVHLTAEAVLALGKLLADAMHRLLGGGSASPPRVTQQQQEQQLQQEEAQLTTLSIADTASSHDLSLYASFCVARSRCEDVLNAHYSTLTREDRAQSRKKYPIFGTGLKPVNFVSARCCSPDYCSLVLLLTHSL
jgi:hypothetical protein